MDPLIMKYLLIIGVLLLVGVTSTKLASRVGVPSLILFMVAGMVLGSDVSGLIYFDDAWLAQFIGTLALVVILFEGGLQTQWKHLRRVAVPAASLATLGVIFTVAVTGLIAWWVLDLGLAEAMLVAAIVGSTDAAAVFGVLRGQNIKARLKILLEAESGANDPMAVLLTLLMMEWVLSGPPSFLQAIGFLLMQMGLGLIAGLVFGKLAAWAVARVRFDAGGMYPILLFGTAIFTFAATSWLGGSGFVAVYVLGILLGSLELPYRQSIMRFHEGTASLAQMTMFFFLGLLVFPGELVAVIGPGLLVAGGLMFVSRPIAVWLGTLGMGFNLKEYLLISWAGLRGAVPIVLATFPLLAGVGHSHLIFNIVFFVVLSSCLIQGSTISAVAGRLGLLEGSQQSNAMTLELVAMEKLDVDMVELTVPSGSPVLGKRLSEVPLPDKVTVSALLRNDQVITPRGGTEFKAGDMLFILAHKKQSHRVRSIFEGEEPEADTASG